MRASQDSRGPTVTRSDVPEELAAVAADLQKRVSATSGSTREVSGIRPFGSGHSGFTYSVTFRDTDEVLVLRLSPPGARIAGPNDVGRQGRVIRAAGAHGVPTPHVLDCDSDPVIDGRAFMLTTRVVGAEWDSSGLSDRQVAQAAVGTVQALAEVSAGKSAIGDEDSFAPAAEVARWAALLPRCPEWMAERVDGLVHKLGASAPAAGSVALVHGDLHYGNLLFEGDAVSALLDWEIASLGDPLFDLAALAVASLRAKYAPEPNPTGSVQISSSELADMYAVSPERFAWFLAATCFKYAVILGYNYKLHSTEKRVDPIYDCLDATTSGLLEDSKRILAGGIDD